MSRSYGMADRTPVTPETQSKWANFDTLAVGAIGFLSDEQRQAARRNLAAFALERPDSAEWLADMLSVLGLDGKPVRIIGRCATCQQPIGNRGTLANKRGYCTQRCLKASWA